MTARLVIRDRILYFHAVSERIGISYEANFIVLALHRVDSGAPDVCGTGANTKYANGSSNEVNTETPADTAQPAEEVSATTTQNACGTSNLAKGVTITKKKGVSNSSA